MKDFLIVYNFGHGLKITRRVQAESQEQVQKQVADERGTYVSFTDRNNVSHDFDTSDALTVSVSEPKKPRASAKTF